MVSMAMAPCPAVACLDALLGFLRLLILLVATNGLFHDLISADGKPQARKKFNPSTDG